jgi:hypothetical protein
MQIIDDLNNTRSKWSNINIYNIKMNKIYDRQLVTIPDINGAIFIYATLKSVGGVRKQNRGGNFY